MAGEVPVPDLNSPGLLAVSFGDDARHWLRDCPAAPTPVPGLAVASSGPRSWAVVHTGSGIAVATAFTCPEAALSAAVKLGALADWTSAAWLIAERLKTDRGFARARRRIAARWGGTTWDGVKPPPELIAKPEGQGSGGPDE